MIKDAHVGVVDTDATLCLRRARQMCGRSSRMRGPIQGYNFMKAEEDGYTEDWFDPADSRDEKYND